MNALMIVGVILNALVGIAYSLAKDYIGILVIALIAVGISLAGMIMIATGPKRAGAILVIIGAVFFVPLGLLAIFGAKRVLDQVKAEKHSPSVPDAAAQTVHASDAEPAETSFHSVATSTWISPNALFRHARLSLSIENSRVPGFLENPKWRAMSSWISLMFAAFVLVVLLICGLAVSPLFFSARNMHNVLTQFLPICLMAFPMALIFSNGGVDLSIGGVISLSGVLMAATMQNAGSPAAPIVLALGVALVIGLVNGLMVGGAGLPGFLISLATGFMALGASIAISNGTTQVFNSDWSGAGTRYFGWVLLVIFAVLLILWIQYPAFGPRAKGKSAQKQSAFGRACEIGVPFLISSLAAGFVGIWLVFYIRAGVPTIGTNYLYDVLLAVVFAGMYPGMRYGNVFGIIVGAFFVEALRNILSMANVNPAAGQVVLGAIFVFMLACSLLLNAIMVGVYRRRYQGGPASQPATPVAGQ